MTPEKLELMQKWQTVITLMGINMDDIHNDWDSADYFYGLLDEYETHQARLANPSETMRAVLMTVEMGVTTDDVDQYQQHLEQQEELAEIARLEQLVNENPLIVDLRQNYDFEIFNSKQYPTHTHFRFKDSKGKLFTGRVFSPSWKRTRVWLIWRDNTGKRESFRWDYRDSIAIHKDFPEAWSYWGYAKSNLATAHVIARHVVKKTMPPNAKFTYPK